MEGVQMEQQMLFTGLLNEKVRTEDVNAIEFRGFIRLPLEFKFAMSSPVICYNV